MSNRALPSSFLSLSSSHSQNDAGPSTAKRLSKHGTETECCKVCLGTLGRTYHLEYTDENMLACSVCGLVDEAATFARNTINVSEKTGAQLDPIDFMRTFDRDWLEFESKAEKSFKVSRTSVYLSMRRIMMPQEGLDSLFYIYLIDPKTSVFGYSTPSILKAAKMWYLRIRQAEQNHYQRKDLANNASARRVKYQVGVAIKIAVQENSTKILHNRLGRLNSAALGLTKADDRIPMLSLAEIFVGIHQRF